MTIAEAKKKVLDEQKRVFTDTDPMPFGKYMGTPMQDVPASYLFWLWTKGGMEHDKVSLVAGYIRANLDALEKEYPDGVWR